MLIVDENLLAIDSLLEDLAVELIKSDRAGAYLQAQRDFKADKDLQEKLQLLDENRDFLAYRQELRALQRELTVDPKVYALRLAENDLQEELSALTKRITAAISPHIYVDENLPLRKGQHGRHHRRDT